MNDKNEALKELRKQKKKQIVRVSEKVKTDKKNIKAIKEYLKNRKATVPEIAETLGMLKEKALWYVMALKKYGEIMEAEKDGDFFRYFLKQKEKAEV
jgi:DNA-directed RNA polymerase specialized sigma subunit